MDRSKLHVVQFYTGNVQYAKYTEEINRAYCEKKGYSYFCETDSEKINSTLVDRAPTWYKPKLILDVFERFNPEYILFLDIDAAIIDFEQDIEQFIDEAYDVIFAQDYSGHSKMNAGVFLIKNTEWSKNLMNRWWFSGEFFRGADAPLMNVSEDNKHKIGYYKQALWHDQTCLSVLYDNDESVRNKLKIIENRSFNWKEAFDNNFIFHAFAYGGTPYRRLNHVHSKIFNIEPEVNKDSLSELAMVYPTDKQWTHDYYKRAYQDALFPIKDSTSKVVEIGVLEGYSLVVWREFFKNANIIGLDISPTAGGGILNMDRITIQTMDVSVKQNLESFAKQHTDIDVFVDDGSHKMEDQQIALATLFKSIKPGGIYILEDLHTSVECRMPEKAGYNWGNPNNTTALDVLQHFEKTGKVISDYMTSEEIEYLENNIESVKIFDETNKFYSITSIIRKKKEEVRTSSVIPSAPTSTLTPIQFNQNILTDMIKSALREVLIEANVIIPPREQTLVNSIDEVPKPPKSAVVFYCWTINDWEDRTRKTFERFKSSGLYDAADELHFVVSDQNEQMDRINTILADYPKVQLSYSTQNHAEYPGIKKVEEIAGKGDYNILYTHCKGVFNQFRLFETKEPYQLKIDSTNSWVDMMLYFLVDNWKDCIAKLNDNDTVGVTNVHRWWWGNFWWTKSEHVRKLRPFEGGPRWASEAYLHEHHPDYTQIKFHEYFHFNYDAHFTILPRYLYDNSDKSDIQFTIKKALFGSFEEQRDEGRSTVPQEKYIDVTNEVIEATQGRTLSVRNPGWQVDTTNGTDRSLRIFFSTNREPDVEYVITGFSELNVNFPGMTQ